LQVIEGQVPYLDSCSNTLLNMQVQYLYLHVVGRKVALMSSNKDSIAFAVFEVAPVNLDLPYMVNPRRILKPSNSYARFFALIYLASPK